MHYFAVALYSEAKPLIEHFRLKKEPPFSRFQIFANGRIRLAVTGPGAMNAAVSTAYMLTLHRPEGDGVFFNIGICGAASDLFTIGQPVLCHKIIHRETNRTYYPDMLIAHSLREGVLETVSRPVQAGADGDLKGDFVDMEGAGCYEAASAFFAPHQMYFLKIVSDKLDGRSLTPEEVSALVQRNIPVVERLMELGESIVSRRRPALDEEEWSLLARVREQLKLSATLNHQLIQLAVQYKIRTGRPLARLFDALDMQAQSKHEGKILFEQLRRKLLHE